VTPGANQSYFVELLLCYSNQTAVRFDITKFTTALAAPRRETTPDQAKLGPKQRHRRLSRDQTQQLIARYQAGETARQLGEAFNINRKTVCKVLSREGVTPRWRKLTDTDITQAIELYESGLSLACVGHQLGVDSGTILNHFRRLGIDRRSVGTNQWT
jgi:hypothetical protein